MLAAGLPLVPILMVAIVALAGHVTLEMAFCVCQVLYCIVSML